MGMPGHIQVEITTSFNDEKNTISRHIKMLNWYGLNGLSFCSYFDDIAKGKSSEYINKFICMLYSDTSDLKDGIYKLANIKVDEHYKYRPIEEVPENERDMYE
jgi:hypothetical protein